MRHLCLIANAAIGAHIGQLRLGLLQAGLRLLQCRLQLGLLQLHQQLPRIHRVPLAHSHTLNTPHHRTAHPHARPCLHPRRKLQCPHQ